MKQSIISLLALALLLGIVWVASAAGRSLTLPWWTVDGGGGESTGSDYTLHGTIGQPEGGTLQGNGYTLEGGFWVGAVALSSPGATATATGALGTNGFTLFLPAVLRE